MYKKSSKNSDIWFLRIFFVYTFNEESILNTVGYSVSLAEQQRYAPSGRKGYKYIDDTADKGALPAESPGNQVKTENPDKSPVKSADY